MLVFMFHLPPHSSLMKLWREEKEKHIDILPGNRCLPCLCVHQKVLDQLRVSPTWSRKYISLAAWFLILFYKILPCKKNKCQNIWTDPTSPIRRVLIITCQGWWADCLSGAPSNILFSRQQVFTSQYLEQKRKREEKIRRATCCPAFQLRSPLSWKDFQIEAHPIWWH